MKKDAPESTPLISLKQEQHKDTHLDQFNQTKAAFFSTPRTMMEVARMVGIDRANVCWYVRNLRKANGIYLIRKGDCPETHWPGVGFYSTDPKYAAKQPKQLSLF